MVGSGLWHVCGTPHLCPTLFPCVMQLEWGRVGMLKGCLLLPQGQPLGFSSVHRASSGSRALGSGEKSAAGWAGGQGSVESTAPQIFGDDDVCHSIKDKLDVVGVRGTGDMGVDFLVS